MTRPHLEHCCTAWSPQSPLYEG